MATSVSVFGLGYVGCVSAACLADAGHRVIGVDINAGKVDLMSRGIATFIEAGVSELVAAMVAAKRLSATTSTRDAVLGSSISVICVGTPAGANGSLDLSHAERVCRDIGEVLREKSGRHTVVVRSTMLPGSTDGVLIPALESASQKRAGRDFHVCTNPEFLRAGSSIADYHAPPFVIIGAESAEAAAAAELLYADIKAPHHRVPIRVAEMLKYACNSFHGLKVAFANEIGAISERLGLDGDQVMRLFCEDHKLNLSARYLRPGFAFGGSCLPKDLRAVVYRARQLDLEAPLLASVLASNRARIDDAFDLIAATGQKRIGVLGLAFKAGTDDLRESPMVALIERLLGKGYNVAIYDREVSAARVVGANREYVEREIPHIWSLMRVSVSDVIGASEVVLIGNGSAEFHGVRGQLAPDQTLLDLAHAVSSGEAAPTIVSAV